MPILNFSPGCFSINEKQPCGSGDGPGIGMAKLQLASTTISYKNPVFRSHSKGIAISATDLAHFSPYPTGRVNRFGVYPSRIKTESGLPNRHLPRAPDSPNARAA